jgi:endonuclease VIII
VPEGDTVHRTADRLDAALRDAVLERAELRWPTAPHVDLAGSRTLEVVARGKHLLHRFDTGATLHTHLRMEGQWRIEHPGERTERALRRHDLRAAVLTGTWSAVGLRLGMLDLVPTAREADLVGHLGPDVLGPDWDAGRAVDNLARAHVPLGQALLDQRNLAGVGTMWCAETLFLERVPPWSLADEVDRAVVERVVSRAHRLIDNGRGQAVQSSTGSYRLHEAHYVHARSGRPCRRCGTTVRVAPIGVPPQERTMFYCPGCQGGLGPSDDGRVQRPLGAEGRSASGGRVPR